MKRLFALVLLFVFIACSGDNGTEPTNNNNGGGGGGSTHEDSTRVVTVRAITHRLNLWRGESQDTIAARATRYLKTRPDIGATGITEGTTVWATFKDGVALIIPNNRERSSSPEDTLLDETVAPLPRSPIAPRHVAIPAGRGMMRALRVPESARELPVSNKFRALDPLEAGTCFVHPLPVIKSLLSKGHYVNVNPSKATVEELSTVRGEGVFYINTHGGVGADANGHTLYALWTTTPFDSVTTHIYASQLRSSELVIMVAEADSAGTCKDLAHIGITNRFVSKYMKFGKQSLVIVDACSSAHEYGLYMRDAFKQAGASVYVGWTQPVASGFAYRSMKYLLDRLLGVNEISPEDPKQRAFNIDQVLNDMRVHRNLVDDPYKHALLTVFHLRDDFGLLSPTIQFLSIDDDGQQPKLIVAGLFGTDPGEGKRSVTVNGQELDNVEWFPTELYCDIPESGSNASGTVVVKVGSGADARESNPVNITEWHGELTYERTSEPGSQTAEMKIKIRILADIHPFREEPGEDPFETTVLFNPRAGDVGVHMTTSGVYERTVASCKDTFTLGQGGDIGDPMGGGQGTDGSWVYFGSVDTKNPTLQLNIAVLGVFKMGQWVRTRVGPDPCDPFTLPLYATMAIEDCLYDLKIQTPAFQIQMNDGFVVPEGSRGPCAADPLVTELNDDFDAQAKIRWNEMTPFFLPDPDAAR